MRTILSVLLTSLVWSFVIVAFFEPREKGKEQQTVAPVAEQNSFSEEVTSAPTKKRSAKKAEKKAEKRTEQKAAPTAATKAEQKTAPTTTTKAEQKPTALATESIDYAREIDGKWTPVEGAKYALEFTKYGVVIQHHGPLLLRHRYSLSGKKMNIHYDKARVEIIKEGDIYYLEIYNSDDYSGKYKRVSQPRKIAMRPLPESQYSELINGKWTPVNGQEYSLEFTKYGTAIQYHEPLDLRHDYSLTGAKLNIKYDNNARVVISEDASYYYLEIYNSEDFSGRYRKSK